MIDKKKLQKLEMEFSQNNKDFILNSWEDSHHLIPNLIREKDYKTGAEIGLAFGSHSFEMLEKTQLEKLYGIDPYLNYQEYQGDSMNFPQDRLDQLFVFVKERLSYFGERFELIRDFSHTCHQRFEDESLDFTYIDGNHYEGFIKRDLDIWWKKIKVGGMISGHDYNHPFFPHVTISVNQFFSKLGYSVNYLGNHVWCVFK